MKAEHYYTKKPTSKLRTQEITATLKGEEYKLITGSGTFSPSKIDLGTRVLIEKAEVKKGDRILDLGCGYGPVGIAFADKAEVVMTDINQRATALARKNLELNKLKAEVKKGDGYEKIEGKFDVILLNPPQTAGRKLCNRLIVEAKEHLKNGGNIQIVARHQKGGKQFEKLMQETYGNVDVLGKQSGYRVYKSEKIL